MRYRLTLLMVLVTGLTFLLALDNYYRAEVRLHNSQELDREAENARRALQWQMGRRLAAVTDLQAFVLASGNVLNAAAFDKFAASLIGQNPVLSAAVYVDARRVVRHIFPLRGHEQGIGLDLTECPSALFVEKAVKDRRLTVDNPHPIVGGRLSVIARAPLYREDEFTGLVQGIIDVSEVVDKDLGELRKHFDIQLRDSTGRIFWGPPQLAGETRTVVIPIGDNSWSLSIAWRDQAPVPGLFVPSVTWGSGGALLLSILFSIRRSQRQTQALTRAVAERTDELMTRNWELEREIAERRHAEEGIKQSEARLAEAQQIAHFGSWEWDIADNGISCSEEMHRIFGLEPGVITNGLETLLARVHEEDRPAVMTTLTSASPENPTYVHEYRIITPNGSQRFIRGVGQVSFDDEGKPLRLAGVVIDITETKRALQALRESEEKYRALMENASDGILLSDLEGNILDVNKRALDLFGYAEEELVRMHVSDIHPKVESDKLQAAFQSIRETGTSLEEHLVLRKDGSVVPVEVAGTLISYGGGKLALGTFRDITQRKQIEEELRRHRDELERNVADRTKELQSVNNELESFSYSVSHDLRAPLRAINGFSQALGEDCGDDLSDEGKEYLARIIAATNRMNQLIDDLLVLSRTMRSEVRRRPVNLSTLAEEIGRELLAAEPERHVTFSFQPDITVYGDGTLLRSLLQNLLGNAWKYTRKREQAVIEFGRMQQEGEQVFFVKDNGTGFDMRFVNKLFHPFQRLHQANEYEGSGVGLATVQRIASRHGGRVWAEGKPDQGASFFFTLGNP